MVPRLLPIGEKTSRKEEFWGPTFLSNFDRDNCFALCYWTNQELHNQVLVHPWLVRQLVLLTPKDGQAAVELGPGVAKKSQTIAVFVSVTGRSM
jgi:hypothetical protein